MPAELVDLNRIVLNLARSREFPGGSSRHGYDFIAPLDSQGHIDPSLWKKYRNYCRVRRFWAGEEDEVGRLVHKPGGTEHALGSDPAAIARTGPGTADRWHTLDSGAVRIGREPVAAQILCADYGHDAVVSTQVLGLLPELVHIRDRDGGLVEDTVRLLGRELATPRLATGIVLDRLVDVLLVQVLRAWLDRAPEQEPSWLGVLSDDIVGAAVTRLHEDPARPWTTGTLARETGVSRATLARRFTATTGESPGAYLTRWRMDLAARRLRDTEDSLEVIARAVGYTSVYAFSRAFSSLTICRSAFAWNVQAQK